jgi:hypothetical protein
MLRFGTKVSFKTEKTHSIKIISITILDSNTSIFNSHGLEFFILKYLFNHPITMMGELAHPDKNLRLYLHTTFD